MLTNVIAFLLTILLSPQPAAAADQEIQRIAMEGWLAARALAPKGGAVELLGPVNLRLRDLDRYPHLSARYAEAAIRAAVAAAQEEREEMALFLEHARGLSDDMAIGASPAQWPVPIDELAGELWLEVDRFTEARDAYRKATELKPSPNAWIGLARASDKLGDIAAACRAYKNASSQKLPSSVELEISLYNLKCR